MGKWFWAKTTIGLVAILWLMSSAFGNTGGVATASEGQIAVSSFEIGALTSAPPAPATSFSVFDPNHVYLYNGSSSITAVSGSASISGSTTAVSAVDSIGVTFYLQKWNGSAWETVGSGSTTGSNQASVYNNTVSKPTTAGYYYRARTIHWVIENGVYEEGERLTGSVLAI